MENSNKYYGTSVLITAATFAKLDKNQFSARKVSTVKVAGKQKETDLYEISSDRSEPKLQLFDQYEEALSLYENNRMENSEKVLEKILEKYPKDGPSVHLQQRIEEARNRGWSRVETLAK